jgi:hypothetical protein
VHIQKFALDPVVYRFEPLVSRKFIASGIVARGTNMFSGLFGFGRQQQPNPTNTTDIPSTTPSAISIPISPTPSLSSGSNLPTNNSSGSYFQAVDNKQPTPSTSPSFNSTSPAVSPSRAPSPVRDYQFQAKLLDTTNFKDSSSKAAESNSEGSKQPSYEEPIMEDDDIRLLNPTGRIDYALQEGVLEYSYFSSISSHMAYWPDLDVASLMLSHLYPNE